MQTDYEFANLCIYEFLNKRRNKIFLFHSPICRFADSLIRRLSVFSILMLSMVALAVGGSAAEEVSQQRPFGGDFLRELTAPRFKGMGGSFAGTVTGVSALHNNPAGLALFDENSLNIGDATSTPAGLTEDVPFAPYRTEFNLIRISRTFAAIAKPNAQDKYEDFAQYDLKPQSIESFGYAFPVGRQGAFGLHLALQQEGRFSRVNEEGKAVNTFPENHIVLTLGYGQKLFAGMHIGVDVKWIRSKVEDVQGGQHIGRGFAVDVGWLQKFGKHLKVGVAIRNLSSGLDFHLPQVEVEEKEPSKEEPPVTEPPEVFAAPALPLKEGVVAGVPEKLRRDVVLGVAYQPRTWNDFALQTGLDISFPFERGFQTNLGGTIWYRNLIGLRLGYVRHVQARLEPLLMLDTQKLRLEERLWIQEGLTFGLGLVLYNLELNVAHTPQHIPQTKPGEKIRFEKGDSLFSLSVSQRF